MTCNTLIDAYLNYSGRGTWMTGAVHGNTEIPAAHDTIGRPSTAPTDKTGTDGRTGNAQFTQGERLHQNTSVIVT